MNPRCIENEMNNMENMNMEMMNQPYGSQCPPIYECPTERVCERIIMHEVPHIIPINTKVINRHIYKHTFTPCFTMSECDTCENVYDQCCGKNF